MGVPTETVRAAENSLKTLLNQAFEGVVVFDPVQVESTSDHYGEDNLNIIVVYDGEYARLDPHKLNRVSTELASILAPLGFHNIPTESYIHKSEYADWLALKRQPPWERETG